MRRLEYTVSSDVETKDLGYQLGLELKENSVLCLFGDLGAGKTTFVKGLVAAFEENEPLNVNSPTFVYLNIYPGRKTIYHFDLYRLRDADEFLSMGFDELFYAGGICCLEWSERITSILPEDCIQVRFTHVSENVRHIAFKY